MTPTDYIEAARVPHRLKPQSFGLWQIERVKARGHIVGNTLFLDEEVVGFPDYTILSRQTLATLHKERGEIVMEDSALELRKHLPIWLAARGRVLVTGLGLGCVVRGLLANPDVDQVDVVEIDRGIARVVGHEFASNPRVRIVVGDATSVPLPGRFDFAWHDLWSEDDHLQRIHLNLFVRFRRQCRVQGAWAFPRMFSRLMARRGMFVPLGAPGARRLQRSGRA